MSFGLLSGCLATLGGGDGPPEEERLPCDPALTLTPDGASVAGRGVLIVRAEGGSGDYRYAVEAMGTGTRIDDRTGVLVGGDVPGTVRVSVTDVACEGSASVTAEVAARFALEPASATVAPGTTITFALRGGAGPFEISLDPSSSSGGSVSSSGVYVAGASAGDDIVRARDTITGAAASAIVRVRPGAGLSVESARVILPVGSTHELAITGGSGYFDVTSSGAAVSVEGTILSAASAGRVDVRIVDRFTAAETQLRVTAVAAADAPSPDYGTRVGPQDVLSADVDGDGRRDAIVALPGSSVGGYRVGAVMVFRGTEGGMESAPSLVLTGTRREDFFGTAIALGDVDADGRVDLLVGAWQADLSAVTGGGVFIYRGREGMLFDPTPMMTLTGRTGGDRFGVSVAACDFDGDGDLDIAVGAADAEDRMVSPRADQQGAVYVYASLAGRFLDAPSQVIYGRMLDTAGATSAFANFRFGASLASGDFDGDGRCDLAVRAERAVDMGSNDGAVLLYRGRAAAMAGLQGGLETAPALVVSGADPADGDTRLGSALAMGDLDGDGLAELAIGQFLHDAPGAADAGAARIFRGRALSGPASAAVLASAADWTYEATSSSQWYGAALRIAEATGDASLDLLVGDTRATLMDAPARTGAVRVFAGRAGALPPTTPAFEMGGVGSEDRYGSAFDVVDDVDGDRRPDLVVHAALADARGLEVGETYLVTSTRAPTSLDAPSAPAGRWMGFSLAVTRDLTGDGVADLVAGAPRATSETVAADRTLGYEHGSVYVYAGGPDGFATTPTLTLAGFAGHSDSDWFGYDVADGDFDGDGLIDLVVLARFEDRAATYDPTLYAVEAGCDASADSDLGAAYVFRGSATGIATTPSFIVLGPASRDNSLSVEAAFDFDGDDIDDLALGGTWRNAAGDRLGGVAVYAGRAADAGGLISVVCTPVHLERGLAVNDELGARIAPLGDVDADGCDDLAVGAPGADSGFANDEGAVRVVAGFGAACASATPRGVWLRPFDRAARAGEGLAAADMDGDGLRELFVGAPRYTTAVGQVGRVYAMRGVDVAAALLMGGEQPLREVGTPASFSFDGIDAGERAGSSLAALPPAGARPALVVIGTPFAAIGGVPNAGGARVLSFAASGFGATPYALISGETPGSSPNMGLRVAAGGQRFLAIGALYGAAQGIDQGSAYGTSLE